MYLHMKIPPVNFTDDDLMFPVYCIQCKVHISQQISNVNGGLCAKCLNYKNIAPPPVVVNQISKTSNPLYVPLAIGAGVFFLWACFMVGNYRERNEIVERKRQEEYNSPHEVVKREREAKNPKPIVREPEVPPSFPGELIFDCGLSLVLDSVSGRSGQYTGDVTGTVINRYGGNIRYAQIEINLYDESGSRVGSTFDNITNFAPGETWQFKAVTFTNFHSYKVVHVIGR